MPMNYSTLIGPKATPGSLRNWLNWDKLVAGDVLEEAQAWIYSKLRVREMIAIQSATITLAATQLAMPANFISALSFKLTGDYAGDVVVYEERDFENQINLDALSQLQEGVPDGCMIIGDPAVAYFNWAAIDAIPYRLVYYSRPDSLSAGNATNWLTTRYPQLLRYACLGVGNEYKQDWEKADRYLKMALGLAEAANAESDMAKEITRHEPFNHSNE